MWRLNRPLPLNAQAGSEHTSKLNSPTVSQAAFVSLVHKITHRGWSPATGGNFGTVVDSNPLKIAITPSGIDKSTLTEDQLIVVDERAQLVSGNGKPSAETLLHVTIAQTWGGMVILHTHTVWNTLASLTNEPAFVIEGLEMVKALSGTTTHEHTELVPIVPNSQDMVALASDFRAAHAAHPAAHGVLIRGHGLYTWGHSNEEAWRHLEALEFLFEVVGRR